MILLRCQDCGKEAALKPCEKHNPRGAKICKDCCISKYDGHRCPWWGTCHGHF